MRAEISRDGILILKAKGETERFALEQWFRLYTAGNNATSPWGLCIDAEGWPEPPTITAHLGGEHE
jgi:hypothetical protein